MKKRLIASILALTMILGLSVTANAATTKRGTTCTGAELLEFVEDNVPTPEEVEEGTEAEVAVIIQTRALASIKTEGFSAINFGMLVTKKGEPEGSFPDIVRKKRPRKECWRYITAENPEVYIVDFTNVNEKKASLFQKKGKYDAFKEAEDTFYAFEHPEGKLIPTSCNTSALYDENNALYIYEDRNYQMYEIKNPESDEIIGMFFVEQKRPSANPAGEKYK